MMKIPFVAGCLFLAALAAANSAAAQGKKEYLSSNEAERVRDADTNSDRIQLFIGFAADRIKKLQYEIDHQGQNTRPVERINGLILNYTDCLDDAADLIDEAADKNEDIRKAIQKMRDNAPMFLEYLKGLQAQGRKMEAYKDNLDDAVEATNDAIHSASEADKQIAPPPVRRRPQ